MASYNPNNLSPDELSCPICFEEFTNLSSSENVPKLLLCLHTFCLGCIRSLVRSNKTIQCSICRTEHTDVSPQELFDNYVIMEYVRKKQEESDACAARELSWHLKREPDQSGFNQQRQEQLQLDAELARHYQELYDREERPNTGGTSIQSCSKISAPTVSVVQPPEVLCTAQESLPQPAVVASCSRYCRPPLPPNKAFSRSSSNSASSSSPSTSSLVTISSNTFSDTSNSSSDDRCSSRESSSSRIEEEFVDTVETLEVDDDAGIAGAATVAAGDVAEEGDVMEASGSTCTASALSPAYTENSGFSHHDESNDSHHRAEHDDYNDDHHSVDQDNYDEDEDRASDMDDNSYHVDDDNNEEDSDDMNSLHLGETFSEHIEDDAEEDNLDGDAHHDSDLEEEVVEEQQEDELFNNLSVLEAIDPSPECPAAAPNCHDNFSNDDSCISISSTESYSGLPNKEAHLSRQFNPVRRNFPLSVHSDLSDVDRFDVGSDDNNDTVSTITVDDSVDSTCNATNKTYNTRSRATNVATKGKEDRLNT